MVSSYLRVLCLVALLAVNVMAETASQEALRKAKEAANASAAAVEPTIPASTAVEEPIIKTSSGAIGDLTEAMGATTIGGDDVEGEEEPFSSALSSIEDTSYDLTPEFGKQTLDEGTSSELNPVALEAHANAQKHDDEIEAMSSMLAHEDIAASPPPPHEHAAAVIAKKAQHRATGHAALKKAVEGKGKTTEHATKLHDDRVAVYGHGGPGMTFKHVFHVMTEAQIEAAVGKDPIKSDKKRFIELGKKKLELRTHMHTLEKGTITEENLAKMSEADINKHEHELSQKILKHTKGKQAHTDEEKKKNAVAKRAQGNKTRAKAVAEAKKAKKGAPKPPTDAKKPGAPAVDTAAAAAAAGKTGGTKTTPNSPTSPHHGGPK